MANNSSPALVATSMLMMLMIGSNLELIIADPSPVVANQEPYSDFRYACAIKCGAKCLRLPTLELKLACAAPCIILSCLTDVLPSENVVSCTIDCAKSSDDGIINWFKDIERLARKVDVCYHKCKNDK